MSRRSIPNQRKAYKDLNKRLNGYTRKIVAIYSMLAYESALYAIENGYDGDGEFHFSDYPKTKKKANTMFQNFRNNMQTLIYSGISDEWKRSNAFQDQLANGVIKTFKRTINEEMRKLWYDTNSGTLEAFKKRKTAGLTISQRIWKDEPLVRANLERALTAGIAKGVSAAQLSKRVTKYLNDYSSLSRDYRKKCGKAIDIAGCEYRSVRLARNEINLAYRTAEQERWKKMDYIKGKRIRTTQNLSHKADMCDALAGDYPKDFQWTGWHVNCMCYTVPIVMSEEEYWSGAPKQYIQEPPEPYNEWLKENTTDILNRRSIPNFITDNERFINSSTLLNYKRHEEYLKLKNSGEYTDVEINAYGGLKAIHIGHNRHDDVKKYFNNTMSSTDLEMEFLSGAYDAGHSIIFRNENVKVNGNVQTSLDMILDGRTMDIRSITQERAFYGWPLDSKNDQLRDFIRATNPSTPPDSLCLYFHDESMYADDKITRGYEFFVQKAQSWGKTIYLKNVICAIKTANGLVFKEFNF